MKAVVHKPGRLLCVVILSVLFSSLVHAHEEVTKPSERLIFGISPFMSPMALVKRMAPLRTYLSGALDVEVTIETATDAKDFARRTLAGHYDFVLTSPTFSLMAMDHGGFEIVATQKKKLSGHFVVLADSDIQDIKDLADKRMGAPPKIGFMGQLIEPYLRDNIFTDGNMPEIKYFPSHNGAISALRLGDTEATLIVSFMENHLRSKGIPIRTIHRTEAYPGMTILARQQMPAELVKKLRASLYALDQERGGMQVLEKISMSGFQGLDMQELQKVRLFLPPETIR
ncbi:MAG: phosphate/phosphite/phosphonate ABC transporter substrate-binding protein [Gammaproteobacteria bacterium]|nr:phosphate/phosphite/phosphonate ABC transporter substrate-binding protein [Gammaproteobacteria bacterium]